MTTVMEVMAAVSAGELSLEQGIALANELTQRDRKEAEAKVRAELQTAPTWQVKVGNKGGVIFHGVDKPISLMATQWEFLLSHKDDILSFIERNKSKLAGVPAPVAPTVPAAA